MKLGDRVKWRNRDTDSVGFGSLWRPRENGMWFVKCDDGKTRWFEKQDIRELKEGEDGK